MKSFYLINKIFKKKLVGKQSVICSNGKMQSTKNKRNYFQKLNK